MRSYRRYIKRWDTQNISNTQKKEEKQKSKIKQKTKTNTQKTPVEIQKTKHLMNVYTHLIIYIFSGIKIKCKFISPIKIYLLLTFTAHK